MNTELTNMDYLRLYEQSNREWLAFREVELTPDVISKMVVHSNYRSRLDAINSRKATQSQIEFLFNDEDKNVRSAALSNLEKITPLQMEKALSDESYIVRIAALMRDEVTQAQAEEAFKEYSTRYEALRTGKLPKSLIDLAMADDSFLVRDKAAELGGKRNFRGTLKNIKYRVFCFLF